MSVNLTLAASVLPRNRPAKVVGASLNYAGGVLSFGLPTPPASPTPISAYQLLVQTDSGQITITVTDPLPVELPFTPELYPSAWVLGQASWDANIRVVAVNGAGAGAPGPSVAVPVTNTGTYSVQSDDWVAVEVRNEGAPVGRVRVTVDPSVTVPEGWSLHRYSGPLAYSPMMGATSDESET